MTNIEFQQYIVRYLPYRPKCKWIRDDNKQVVCDLTISDYNFLIVNKNAKPLLRPLSDLTNPIKHNEKEFIPIVELAKIEAGYFDEGKFIKGDIGRIVKIHIRSQVYHADAYILEHKGEYTLKEYFSFKAGDFNRMYSYGNGFHGCILRNQQILFQKLYEWNFDIHSLISEDKAIDINTQEFQ